jgi:predicted aconitase
LEKGLNEKVFRKILDSIQTGRRRYVKISSAHLSGISYLNIGDAGLEFLEDLSKSGLRFRVRTTINPGCVDFDSPTECHAEVFEKQRRIIDSLKKMGAFESLTCTPYLSSNIVDKDQKIAWAESSAALYANSVIGAFTNKEGSLTALASAILGYTARYGVHVRNGRRPEILFEYHEELEDELEYGLLGYVMGIKAGAQIPYLRLRKAHVLNLSYCKQLLASFGTSGGAPIVWIENVTPGFSKIRKPKRKMILNKRELEEAKKSLSEDPPLQDGRLIFITGCPHLSMEEVESMLEALSSVSRLSVEAWVFTSHTVYSKALQMGIVEKLFEKGVKVFKDSCVMHCSLKGSGACVITNSVKASYYLRNSFRLKTVLKSLKGFIEAYGVK